MSGSSARDWVAARFREWRLAAGILVLGVWRSPLVDPDELHCLAEFARRSPGEAVEIGTFNGASTSVISRNLPPGARLTAIDPYVDDSMDPTLRGSRLVARCTVFRHGDLSRVTFVRDWSFNVARRWRAPIGFLWIDGDHRSEAVKHDFEDWSAFVRPGGHILFHDSNRPDVARDEVFDNGWRGPTRVCDEIKQTLSDHYEHLAAVRSLNVFRKQPA
jgi:predicted O-methyltransferase YrrM